MAAHAAACGLAVAMTVAVAPVAAAETVDCAAGKTIAAALARAKPGETILVRGLCRENLTIAAELHDVTLDGGGKAAIVAPSEREPVLAIAGRAITLRGIGLAGGRDGIDVLRDATAVIDGVTIEDNGSPAHPGSGVGISIGQRGFAAIVSSTIRRNASFGILIQDDAGARIGFIDTVANVKTNTITDNASAGILLTDRARANVVGATISRNKGDGISVLRGSELEVAANTIEANDGNGITVTERSLVRLTLGPGATRGPGRTSPAAANTGYGIACSLGSTVAGPLGRLTGVKGVASFSADCSNNSTP